MKKLNAAGAGAILIAVAIGASGTTETMIGATKFWPADGQDGDVFGYSAHGTADYLAAGAWHADDLGDDSGSVYIYERELTGWRETKLLAPDGAAGDLFGGSLEVYEDWLIVGASGDDDQGDGAGSAYAFVDKGDEGWNSRKLVASDGAAGDQYGTSVSVQRNAFLVGAPKHDSAGTDAGAAYLYRPYADWLETKFTASDGAPGDRFGYSVSFHNRSVLVGALAGDGEQVDSGAAYLFQADDNGTWTQTKFMASDGQRGDSFGASVSVYEDWVLVGAPADQDFGVTTGAAYLYRPDGAGGWTETKITASDAASGDVFGRRVALDQDWFIVGAYGDDDAGQSSGAAYLYQPDGATWRENKYTAPDAKMGDRFGGSVSLDGDQVFVAAITDDVKGLYSGSAYRFIVDSDGDCFGDRHEVEQGSDPLNPLAVPGGVPEGCVSP